MHTITCHYCGTAAPPGDSVDDAVRAALANKFTEIEKRASGALLETFYLCDICYYMNVEFTEPAHWQTEQKEDQPMTTPEELQTYYSTEWTSTEQPAPDVYTQKTLFQLLPERERPARRIAELGTAALSNYELLATVIGGAKQIEIAQELIAKFSDLQRIYNAHPQTLTKSIKGMTEATALRIKAALAVGQRMTTDKLREKTLINSPADAATLIQFEMQSLEFENLWVLCLDRRNQLMEICKLYRGSVSSSQVRISEVMHAPITINASAIIIAHNHPSGDPTPSPDDVALTRAIVQAAKMMDIEVLDHLVVGQGRWISLKERGLGFS